jgi:hypothetical protein
MTHDEMARIAVRVLTERMAKQEIKELLRKQGVKLSYVPAREIAARAKAWLAAHPEIIAEAKASGTTDRNTEGTLTHVCYWLDNLRLR